VFQVDMRVRALLRHQVVEFTKRITLPFVPVAWMVLQEGEDGDRGIGSQIQAVTWSIREERFVCLMLDDVDAANTFGEDAEGLIGSYEARGWEVHNSGPVTRLFVYDETA
jgi:hypothetical protein